MLCDGVTVGDAFARVRRRSTKPAQVARGMPHVALHRIDYAIASASFAMIAPDCASRRGLCRRWRTTPVVRARQDVQTRDGAGSPRWPELCSTPPDRINR
jgi:hypothetical protein